MNSKAYIVVYPTTSKFAEAEAVDPQYDNNQRESCPLCGKFITGSKWVGEKVIKLNKKNIPDFLYVYGGSNLPFVISKKAYNVLIENEIIGIVKVEKIDKIIFKGNVLNETFYQIYLDRSSCAIDHTQSKIAYGKEQFDKKCKLCNPIGRSMDFIFGFQLESTTNIDKDIFNIYEMGGAVLLSERFVEIYENNRLTGLFYEDIMEHNSAKGIYSEEEILQILKKN